MVAWAQKSCYQTTGYYVEITKSNVFVFGFACLAIRKVLCIFFDFAFPIVILRYV